MKFKVNNMFATPESQKELNDWITATNDPMVITAAMMMMNFIVANNEVIPKKK